MKNRQFMVLFIQNTFSKYISWGLELEFKFKTFFSAHFLIQEIIILCACPLQSYFIEYAGCWSHIENNMVPAL